MESFNLPCREVRFQEACTRESMRENLKTERFRKILEGPSVPKRPKFEEFQFSVLGGSQSETEE